MAGGGLKKWPGGRYILWRRYGAEVYNFTSCPQTQRSEKDIGENHEEEGKDVNEGTIKELQITSISAIYSSTYERHAFFVT